MAGAPLDSERAREMQRRSAAARRRNNQAQVAELDVARALRRAKELPGRSEIGGLASSVLSMLLLDLLEGRIAVRTAGDAAKVASVLHEILRVEGVPSDAYAGMSREQKLAEMRAQIEARRDAVLADERTKAELRERIAEATVTPIDR